MVARRTPQTGPIKTIVQYERKATVPMTIVFEEVTERPSLTRQREAKANPFTTTLEKMAKTDETLRFELPYATAEDAKKLRTTLRLLSEAGTAVDRTVRRSVVLRSGKEYQWTEESTPEQIAEGRGKTIVRYADPTKGDTATVTFWTVDKIHQNRAK